MVKLHGLKTIVIIFDQYDHPNTFFWLLFTEFDEVFTEYNDFLPNLIEFGEYSQKIMRILQRAKYSFTSLTYAYA